MTLPTGTVTFLFTDIEGSTRLWEKYPEAMRNALALHDELLKAAIERNGGYVFKTVGDAFCAAFPIAPDALNAAIEAQLGLKHQVWEETGELRIRIGLHTGMAQVRDNDYFGPTLNRTARLQSIAYGGQTLISQAVHELVRDSLPTSVELVGLGAHRLKDLNRAETVYQVLHAQLQNEFPPLRSLDSLPNNLPIQLTSFIGREQEMLAVKRLLSASSLVTLLASGGTGKTRLSLQVGADLLEQYPDGVWFIELAAITDPGMVGQTVADVLGIKYEAGRPITQTLIESIKTRTLLLIIDNCEHLVSACAHLAGSLLQRCPNLRLLVSSREAFNIPGEAIFRVPTLKLPDSKSKQTVESLMLYEAVRLFIDRATSVQPSFAVTNENAAALAALCSRLDGIPLAIELAAARARSLSVEEINSKLDNCFRLLTGGSRTALPRQQTLRALIDWSYDLLNEQERTLFARLAVFRGGWTSDAAESICTDEMVQDWEMLDILSSLADKCLLTAEQTAGRTRYRFLETVRQYAFEKIQATGELETLSMRHLEYFGKFAAEKSALLTGSSVQENLSLLKTEEDNFRAALSWGYDNSSLEAAQLAVWLGQYWYLSGSLLEGSDQLTVALKCVDVEGILELRADVLFQVGRIEIEKGDFHPAAAYLEECIVLCRQLDKKRRTASALNSLGIIAIHHNDLVVALALLEESLALQREIGNEEGVASTLCNLGNLMFDLGDYQAAQALVEECLAIEKKAGNKLGTVTALINLGNTLLHQGETLRAQSAVEESLAIARELHADWYAAYSLCSLARIKKDQGELSTAAALAADSLRIVREVGDKSAVASALVMLGQVANLQGEYSQSASLLCEGLTIQQEMGEKRDMLNTLEAVAGLYVAKMQHNGDSNAAKVDALRAINLLGAASTAKVSVGIPCSPLLQREIDSQLTQLRCAIDEEQFTSAWEAGRIMRLEQAVACALEANCEQH